MPRRAEIAKFVERARVLDVTEKLYRRAHRGGLLAVNYHDVSPDHIDNMRAHFEWFATEFEVVGLPQLEAFYDGRWQPERLALAITFDDGFLAHATSVASALDEFALPGWFFVPTELPSAGPDRVAELVAANDIWPADDMPAQFASWDQWRSLHERHVVGSHTVTHRHLSQEISPPTMTAELTDSYRMLEQELGRPPASFCWCGGKDEDYSASAANLIERSGYRYSFMTCAGVNRPDDDPLQIHRTNVEASYDLALVRLLLAGASELRHRTRKRRINELTSRAR